MGKGQSAQTGRQNEKVGIVTNVTRIKSDSPVRLNCAYNHSSPLLPLVLHPASATLSFPCSYLIRRKPCTNTPKWDGDGTSDTQAGFCNVGNSRHDGCIRRYPHNVYRDLPEKARRQSSLTSCLLYCVRYIILPKVR